MQTANALYNAVFGFLRFMGEGGDPSNFPRERGR